MARPPDRSGFTLIELCLLLVLFALLSALAVPSFSRTIAEARSRAVLDRLAGELFLARSLATRHSRPLLIRFDPATGCAASYAVVTDEGAVLRHEPYLSVDRVNPSGSATNCVFPATRCAR